MFCGCHPRIIVQPAIPSLLGAYGVWPSAFWPVGPALAQTVFNAGRRRAIPESTRANYDAAVATYRQTSLTAFQQVEEVSLPQQPEPADADENASRERQIIEDALVESRGRVSGPNGAAARLRVPPSTLEHRIKKLRIRKSHFKLS